MQTFDVLNPNQPIFQKALLEASAGTGKTFAIENLVLRFITEGDKPLQIQEILVVTFTRKGARELRTRIHKTLTDALHKTLCLLTKKRLQLALAYFEEASILTIHGFAAKMLRECPIEANMTLEIPDEEELVHQKLVPILVKDLLRTEAADLHKKQLDLLARQFGYEEKKLMKALVDAVLKREEIRAPRSFQELFSHFQLTLQKLKTEIDSESFRHEIEEATPFYKGLNEESLVQIENFFTLLQEPHVTEHHFETLMEEGVVIGKLFANENKKKGKKGESAPTVTLTPSFHELVLLIEEARSPSAILAQLASKGQRALKKQLEKEEQLLPDTLLEKMASNLNRPSFLQNVQTSYKAAIVDEFQDTDPLQWEIFEKAFLTATWKGYLYLVGDPKQSIYAFRQADLYTYLHAKEKMENVYSLDTNYRSTPQMIEALNALFTKNPFLGLPREGKTLPYYPVKAGAKDVKVIQSDTHAPVHILVGTEEEAFLEDICARFRKHSIEDHIPLSSCALLVRDRFQGERCAKFLEKNGLPALLQREKPLARSSALPALRDFFVSLRNIRDKSALKRALGGQIFGWSLEELHELKHPEKELSIVDIFYNYKKIWEEEGVAALLRAAVCEEKLLQKEGGAQFYDELLQLGDILTTSREDPEVKLAELEEDEDLTIAQDPLQNNVQILSLHMSKGLEFDIVFPLGLLVKSPKQEIPPLEKMEVDAEKMRLLYVALTRAKQRLYIPLLEEEDTGESPLEMFTAGFLNFKEFVESQPHMSLSYVKEAVTLLENKTAEAIPPLIYRAPQVPLLAPCPIQSFTALTRENVHSFKRNIPQNALPAGPETGTILHEIFETITFGNVQKPEDCLPLIQKKTFQTELEGHEKEIADMIFYTLRAPLDGFRLIDCKEENIFKEMEFFHQEDNGYLKGFIDVVLQHNDKIYLIDWKSNWLGDSPEMYTKDAIHEAMLENGYYLQASIYRKAVDKYLSRFQKKVEGIYYLFLRGIDKTQKNGIYHVRDC